MMSFSETLGHAQAHSLLSCRGCSCQGLGDHREVPSSPGEISPLSLQHHQQCQEHPGIHLGLTASPAEVLPCLCAPVLTSTTHFSSLKGTICTGLIFHFNLLIFGSILQFLLLILDFSPAHEDAWRQHLQPLQATFFFIIQAMKENIK